MNDAESMPFAYITKAKNPCIPPKVVKKPPPFSAKSAQFANFYSESRKIRPIRQSLSESLGISQIHTNFNYSSILFLDTHKTGSNTLLAQIT